MQILSMVTQCLILVCLVVIVYKTIGKSLSLPSFGNSKRGTLKECMGEINEALQDDFLFTTVNVHNMKVDEFQILQSTLNHYEIPARLTTLANGAKGLRVDISRYRGVRTIYPYVNPELNTSAPPRMPTQYEMSRAYQAVLEFPRPQKKKQYTDNVIEVDFTKKQRKSNDYVS